MAKTPGITVRLDEELIARLDNIADRLALSRSDLIRNMLNESLPRYKRTADIMNSDLGNAVLRALLISDRDAQLRLREILDSGKLHEFPEGGELA